MLFTARLALGIDYFGGQRLLFPELSGHILHSEAGMQVFVMSV